MSRDERGRTATIAAAQEPAVGDAFREAMSRLAAGVVMVTCHLDGKPWGLTVSACCSVSMSPPLLLVSLARETASAQAVAAHGRFGVSLLAEGLLDVARFGSARGAPKLVEPFCRDCEAGSPVVAGAIAHVDCAVERVVEAGDHVLFIGLVERVLVDGELDAPPLVYYARAYRRLGERTDGPPLGIESDTIESLLYDYPLPRRFAPLRVAPPPTKEVS